jgi:hypothetical protein
VGRPRKSSSRTPVASARSLAAIQAPLRCMCGCGGVRGDTPSSASRRCFDAYGSGRDAAGAGRGSAACAHDRRAEPVRMHGRELVIADGATSPMARDHLGDAAAGLRPASRSFLLPQVRIAARRSALAETAPIRRFRHARVWRRRHAIGNRPTVSPRADPSAYDLSRQPRCRLARRLIA